MNDERPIEKLLRRYAKKRRDAAGAPTGLHPATRRLLQGEVARQYSKRATAGGREAGTFAQALFGRQARWIWAFPVLIMLGIGTWWMLVPSGKQAGHEMILAQNSSAPAEVVERTRARYFEAYHKLTGKELKD